MVYNYFTGSWTLPTSCPATNATAPTGTTDNGSVNGYWYNDGSRPGSSHTVTYGYDGVNRLSSAVAKDFSNNTFWSDTFTNDPWGNVTCTSGAGGCTPAAYNSNNQMTFVNGQTVNYDSAGDLIQDNSLAPNGPHSYQWDAEGHVISVDNGNTASMTYNALGARVYRTNGARSYSVDPQGQFLGAYWTAGGTNYWNAVVPFAGRTLAQYGSGSPASVYFDHPNALGSGQQWTNWAGGSAGEMLFYPYGQMWGDTTGGTVFQFYASLLYYDPEVGRLSAAEPLPRPSPQPLDEPRPAGPGRCRHRGSTVLEYVRLCGE